jgi:hypothetical protein
MGSMNGEVRGKSKIEVYTKYLTKIDGVGQSFLDHTPDAKNKKWCYSLMTQDPETEEWVLAFRFQM